MKADENYFLYQKIASATSATVMIHRTMSLLRFFSFVGHKSGYSSSSDCGSSNDADFLALTTCLQCFEAASPAPARLYPVNFTTCRM